MIAADTLHDFIIVVLQDISLVLGIVVAGFVVFKMPIKKWQAWLHRHEEERAYFRTVMNETIPGLVHTHREMDQVLEFIVSELKPNHGSSLKDAVNRIEKMMQHNEALQRGILSQDARPLFITDENADLIWCNAAFLDITNKDSSEVLGKGYWGIINPEELDDVRKQQAAARADQRDMIIYFNVATGDPDFPLIPVEATATPIIGQDDRLEGYVGSFKRLDDHYSSYTDLQRIEGTLDRVESEIDKNQALIRTWLSQEEIPMYMNDMLGNCIWVNNAMTELCGYDSSQLLGKGWLVIVHTDDKLRLAQEIESASTEDREVISYYTLVPGDGRTPFKVKAVSNPLFDKQHEVIGYVGTLTNLEEPHNTRDSIMSAIQEENATNKDMMRAWWYGNPTAMFEATMDGNITWINMAYSELVGQSLSEIKRDGWQAHMSPEDVERVTKEAMASMEEHGAASFQYVISHSGIKVKADAWPIHSAKGDVVGILGTLKPVDDCGLLKNLQDTADRIETHVQLNEALIKGWWSQEDKPLFITDAQGNCTWVNSAMTDLVVMKPSELLGKGWQKLVSPDQLARVRQESIEPMANKQEITHKYTMITGDPNILPFEVEVYSTPILGPDGELSGYLGTIKVLTPIQLKDS